MIVVAEEDVLDCWFWIIELVVSEISSHHDFLGNHMTGSLFFLHFIRIEQLNTTTNQAKYTSPIIVWLVAIVKTILLESMQSIPRLALPTTTDPFTQRSRTPQ